MIFCVDDDNTIRDIEVYTLEQTGFAAKGFSGGNELFEALEAEIPDLIVLDIMMPDMDGIEVLNRLRSDSRYIHIPVIMATAKDTEMDTITGLELGADDYLAKPFGVMEMVARIKAVLRRTAKSFPDNIVVGDIELNEKEHTVTSGGVNVELTYKEFALLSLFMKSKNTVHSRDKLMSAVWGTEYVGESRTVDAHIKTLRQKLGQAGGQIKTVIGVGYKLEDKA